MRIGVDTGGTFTDCVVFEGTRVKVLKVLSTPENAARAISFDMGGTSTDVSLLDGAPRTNLCLEALQRYSTALMREALLRIPDGEYRAEDYLDDDGFDSRPELFASPRLGRCGKTPWGRRHRSRNRIPDRRRGSILSDGRRLQPYGLGGGKPGKAGRNRLLISGRGTELSSKSSFEAPAGSILRIETPGGGGWGNPPVDGSAERS